MEVTEGRTSILRGEPYDVFPKVSKKKVIEFSLPHLLYTRVLFRRFPSGVRRKRKRTFIWLGVGPPGRLLVTSLGPPGSLRKVRPPGSSGEREGISFYDSRLRPDRPAQLRDSSVPEPSKNCQHRKTKVVTVSDWVWKPVAGNTDGGGRTRLTEDNVLPTVLGPVR